MASRSASGLGWDRAVRIPRPPALETAAANGGRPTCTPHNHMVSACRVGTKHSMAYPLHSSLYDGAMR